MYERKKAEAEGPLKGLVGKSYEMMLRMSIIACGASEKDKIDEDCVEWACALVEYLTMECLTVSRQKLDSNDFKDKAMKIYEYIKKRDKGDGVKHSLILQNISMISSANELHNIRKHLEESELIQTKMIGRGIKYYAS